MAIAVRQRPARKLLRPGHRLLRHDRALGVPFVAGTDEAGRGACAGPLVVAAVVLDTRAIKRLPGIADSKVLTPAAREEAYGLIVRHAVDWHAVTIPHTDIDRFGLHVCNIQGMRRACAGLIRRGYASRRIDANDRRSALIVITPRGERLHDAVIPLRQALQKELEAPLSKAEVAELHRILDTLMQYVSEKIGAESMVASPRGERQPPAKKRRRRH